MCICVFQYITQEHVVLAITCLVACIMCVHVTVVMFACRWENVQLSSKK